MLAEDEDDMTRRDSDMELTLSWLASGDSARRLLAMEHVVLVQKAAYAPDYVAAARELSREPSPCDQGMSLGEWARAYLDLAGVESYDGDSPFVWGLVDRMRQERRLSVPGIRFATDLTDEWSRYVIDSVELANEALAESGERFYFDTVDVNQQVIGGRCCWDMFGWIVPDEDVDRFEPLWFARYDKAIGILGFEDAIVEFSAGEDGSPVVSFDRSSEWDWDRSWPLPLEDEQFIRHEADLHHPDSDYLSGSMRVLTEAFRGGGSRFFLESCDAGQYDFPGGKCQDLYGWIVPLDAIPAFEGRWSSGEGPDELADLHSWGVEYVGVTWKADAGGAPVSVFDVEPLNPSVPCR